MTAHRWNWPAFVIAAAIIVWAGAAHVLHGDAAARECDCSCEALNEFKTRMQELSEAAQSGGAGAMTPELTQAAACGAQCAAQWSQCGREAAADPESSAKEESSGKPAKASGIPDAAKQAAAPHPLGEPREDLERFYGVYGDGDSGRNFFVTAARRPEYAERQIPPGYLMIGAMWGDVAPWYMKSVSETRFEQQWTTPGAEPIIAEFETNEEGGARTLVFETVFDDRGRLQRVGELPEDW